MVGAITFGKATSEIEDYSMGHLDYGEEMVRGERGRRLAKLDAIYAQ
jgi:hypothetical protein